MAGGRLTGAAVAATVVAAALVAALMPFPTAFAEVERDRQALVWDPAWASGELRSGNAVALSHDGRQASVGSPYRLVNGQAGAGSVTVFSRSDDAPGSVGWRVAQTVTSPDPGRDDWFGASLATDSAGSTLIVGIPQDDVDGSVDEGRAAVFVRSGGVLQFSRYLSSAGGAAGDRAGTSVALSDDGATAVVGSPGRAGGQGAATVFTRSPDGSWTERQTLTRTGPRANDSFGVRVALSGDGTLAVAGVPGYDVVGRSNVGAAVPFARNAGAWTEGSLLTRFGGQAENTLGWAVAASVDGSYVIVGSPGYSVGRGAAVVFHFEGAWTQQETLFRAGAVAGERAGSAVAVSDDGGTVVVGAPYVSGAAAEIGAVLQYARSGTTWTAGAQLTRANAAALEHLGTSVALSADGQVALGGAPDAMVGDLRSGAAVSFLAGPPRLVSPATVVGTGVVGSTLTAVPPVHDPSMETVPWFWLSCSRAIVADDPGAEGACILVADASETLVPTADMVGENIATTYRVWNSAYSSLSISASVPIVTGGSAAPVPDPAPSQSGSGGGAPVATVPPTLSEPARAGRDVTTSTGTWDPAASSTAVTWWRCTDAGAATGDPPADCTLIPGAEGTTYRPGAADLGSRLRARVVATNAAGSTSASTAASDPVVGVWAKRRRVTVGSSYPWRRLAGTGSTGVRRLRAVSGPCSVDGRRLRVRGRGACVVRAVVAARAPYPRLVVRLRLRAR